MKRATRPLSTFVAIIILFIVAIAAGQISSTSNKVSAADASTPATGNLILNPSLEQSTSNWNRGSWGKNTSVFTYEPTGHTGAHSVSVKMSKHKNGDAKWYPDPVSVAPATEYTFSDWYKSSVAGELDAVVTSSTGQVSYVWLANTKASAGWKQAKVTFNTPSDASKITFYHLIHKNGTLTTDDYDFELAASATPPTPVIPTPDPTPTPPPVVAPPTTDPDPTPAPDPTPPTVQITSPAGGATVSATQTVSSNVSDAQGIASVQYMLDGQPLGSPVTAAPYSYSWDTKQVANGNHSLAAVATNIANLSTTSTSVTVNVSNQIVVPPSPPVGSTANTIPNPSVETPDSSGGQPQDWTADSWGSNTAAFSYLNTGHTGNRSAKVTLSNYKNGAADWDYTAQNVSAGHYRYTDWYQSDVTSEIDAAVTVNGTVQYYYLGTVLPSATWAQASAEFDIPAGATSITVFHLIYSNGSLTTDDFDFSPYTPAPFNRGIVSLTFDDGWTNQYTNAAPLLNKYGQNATFYIISGELNDQPDYMSKAQISSLIASGNEIGSHTITHPDLTTLTLAQAQNQMQQSQATLQNTFGVPVTDFAYPYGAYNADTINIGKQLYVSQRTVDSGFNTKDNLDLTKLVVQNVFNTTTPAQVEAWIDQANQQHTWLILVYHEVAVTPTDPTDVQYDTQPSDLDAELNYIKNSGIAVETMQQAINEVNAQH